MKLKRTDLSGEPDRLVLTVDTEDLSLDEMDLLSDTISVEMDMNQKGTDKEIRGKTVLTARETCDRCLSPFDSRMNVTFQFMITEKKPLLEGDNDSDVCFFPADEQELDLAPVLRDATFLERSMKRVCSAGCRGLCPRCGTNLNESSCQCEEDRIDDRWAPLKELDLSRTE